ncbi:hypothetical protein MPTK1_7g09590 [Marchantia polymorpha subsp. ruderalis]|uniref:Uncharacterized protein n=2 Tax=Marchantia polymorpha TaxID=3197 RepID=A0AAF6BXT8_MARPO|nr:hypothetical protein MARPO_0156s0025 [Marchantia polymorpha]BBN16822.1 hypothetical protein Mp_7g09590 [Marchantia polymorpha subsp. ruderalis]|eukprot:PTQ28728.1 hypothetical protein MARPO_0156s0025 [Marchantia polymorpha]
MPKKFFPVAASTAQLPPLLERNRDRIELQPHDLIERFRAIDGGRVNALDGRACSFIHSWSIAPDVASDGGEGRPLKWKASPVGPAL